MENAKIVELKKEIERLEGMNMDDVSTLGDSTIQTSESKIQLRKVEKTMAQQHALVGDAITRLSQRLGVAVDLSAVDDNFAVLTSLCWRQSAGVGRVDSEDESETLRQVHREEVRVQNVSMCPSGTGDESDNNTTTASISISTPRPTSRCRSPDRAAVHACPLPDSPMRARSGWA